MDKDLQSRRAEGLYQQAGREMEAGRLDQAQLAIRQALSLQPRAPAYHRRLGEILRRAGKGVLADKAFDAAEALEAALAAGLPLEIEAPEAELSAAERRVLIDHTMRLLTRVAAAEAQMREVGQANRAATEIWSESRGRLLRVVKRARDAWRSEREAPAAGQEPSAGADAPPPEVISEAYRAIPPFTRTLGNVPPAMSKGPEVANLQRLLNLEGLHVTVSGQYDASTAVAVRHLQEQYGLRQRDGTVNVETRQLFNRLTGHGNILPVALAGHGLVRIGDQTRSTFNRLAGQRGTGPLSEPRGTGPLRGP